jgi:opacity protein-like surface antigen
MFVVSFKHNRKRLVITLAVAAAVAVGIWAAVSAHTAPPQAECAGRKYSLAASTNEQRVTFFKQFGWEVVSDPVDTGEVTIPETFNDIYLVYNNIQKEQGLDLQPYAGRTVEQWIYRITNYPQHSTMRGTILVFNGNVIGGDLSTPELNGFMTGFDGQKLNESGYNAPVTPTRGSMGQLTGIRTSSSQAGSLPSASSAEEAKKPVSSTVPANAWPTD